MAFQLNGNLVDQVTEYISERIIRNELQPGMRIYDTKLAKEIGISRTPIREALRILERNRLVELIPRKGVVVTEISVNQIDWFYDIFEQLYGLVARRASENHTQKDIERIECALEKIKRSAREKDSNGYYDHIFEFAAAGLEAAKNPLLTSLIKDLWPSNRRIQYASLLHRRDNLEENVVLFQKASDHMKARNGEMAEATIREYAQTEKRYALQFAKSSQG